MKKIKKIIEYGLYLVVFLLPIQTRLIFRQFQVGPEGVGRGFLEYLSISIYVVDILILFLLSLAFIEFLKNFHIYIKGKFEMLQYFIVGLDLFIFISLFFAFDKMLSLHRYVVFLIGLGLFFLILKAQYSRKKLFLFFFSSLFIQALLAIWQFFVQETFAFKWLGLASHFPHQLGASVIETVGPNGVGERWLRAYGGLDHPNILGGVLAIGIILGIFLMIREKSDAVLSVTDKDDHRAKYFSYLFWVFILVLFLGLVFSFSRSSWLGLSLALLFLIIYFLIRKRWAKEFIVLKVVFVFAILAVIIFSQYGHLFITRLEREGRLEDKSNIERAFYFNESKNIIKENLWFGVGIGNYTVSTLRNREGSYFWTYEPVHNTFLLVLSEIGIFGFLVYIGFLIFLAWQSIKKKKIFNLAFLIILVTIMFFDHWLWSLHFGILLFWMIIGIIIKENDVYSIHKEKTREAYDEYADLYEKKLTKIFLEKYIASDLKKFLDNLFGKKILDLGSGPGNYSVFFKEKEFEPVCIDISREMISRCKQKGLKSYVMDMEKLKFKDESFDGVFAFLSLIHLPKERIDVTLKEIKRVLKKDGTLYIGMKEGNFEGIRKSNHDSIGERYYAYWEKDKIENKLKQFFDIIDYSKIKMKEEGRVYINFLCKVKK